MDPSGLPTDSLYKFWSIGSLLLTVFLAYTAVKTSLELNQRKRRINLRISKHEKVSDHLLDDHVKGPVPPDSDEFKAGYRKRQLQKLALESAKDEFKMLEELKGPLVYLSMFGTGITAISTVVGFVVWYFAVQRHQDLATAFALREQKARTELAELDLSEKLKALKKPSAASSASARPSP